MIKAVVQLKNRWKYANCIASFETILPNILSIGLLKIQSIGVKRRHPNILKVKWITAVLLALIFPSIIPIIYFKAVTQVPTLAPKVINNPLFIPITPFETITMTIPVIADDD